MCIHICLALCVHAAGRRYPRSALYKPGDKLVSQCCDKAYDSDEEFEVEAILDETKISGKKLYLVKWKVRL